MPLENVANFRRPFSFFSFTLSLNFKYLLLGICGRRGVCMRAAVPSEIQADAAYQDVGQALEGGAAMERWRERERLGEKNVWVFLINFFIWFLGLGRCMLFLFQLTQSSPVLSALPSFPIFFLSRFINLSPLWCSMRWCRVKRRSIRRPLPACHPSTPTWSTTLRTRASRWEFWNFRKKDGLKIKKIGA